MNDSVSFTDLTFVTLNSDETKNFWTPERPDSYAHGTAMGRDYAAELIAYMRATDDTQIFGTVIRAITRSGEWGPVEIGFVSAFSVAILNGCSILEPKVEQPVAAAA